MLTIELDGLEAMTQRLQRLAQPPTQAVGEALYEEGNRIMGQSVQLVPVLSGLLRSTAHVERPVQDGPVVEVELSYGGNGVAPYAAIQEWDVSLNHPHGGQAHYLQGPVFAATAGFAQRIAQAIRPALGPSA
jgi:hypothetical protein